MSDDRSRALGIWTSGRSAEGWARSPAGARVIEQLGFEELWISGGSQPGLSTIFDEALSATESITIASGIVTVFHTAPHDISARVAALPQPHQDRFILGLGASHAPSVEAAGLVYRRPYRQMVDYLDTLDALPTPASSSRMLAALGPRMLALAAERSSGAHSYFVPVEHTAFARELMGPRPRLAAEQAVVLEADPTRAREIARRHMHPYLQLPNYTQNLRRFGWSDDDLGGGGSDRLVDAIVAWGDVGHVEARVRAHHDGGADIVLLQVITSDPDQSPELACRELGSALL